MNRRGAGGLVSLVLASALPGAALDIQIVYHFGNSDPPPTDPAGLQMLALFQQAELYYQDIFEDSHTLVLNVWYEDMDDGTLGDHTLTSFNFGTGRESAGDIRMDNGTAWFFDPTPADDSEFNMQQTLWRDLTPTQRSDWYNGGGSIAQTFETGFTGNRIAGNTGFTDMYTVILHEVGHALGMASANITTQSQTSDGDYDFNLTQTGLAGIAAETANESGDDNADIAHIENPNALMWTNIPADLRKLPSHTDLLAMASGSLFVNLDLPRRERLTPGDWNSGPGWIGGQAPAGNDDAIVRNADGSGNMGVFLTANGSARSLTVSEGANVSTAGFKLDIAQGVVIDGPGSQITAGFAGELETIQIDVINSAQLLLSGGTVDAQTLNVNPGTNLTGLSSISLVQVSTRLVNDGRIQASGNSTVTFSSTVSDAWDLDGAGGGELIADNGDLLFPSGGVVGDFSGLMRVGPGHRISITDPWTNRGRINLDGGATFANRARFQGGTILNTFGGEIDASGLVDIEAPVVFNQGDTLVQADGELNLNGFNTVIDGRFTVNNGATLDFNGPVLMNNADFDAPGPSDPGLVTLDGITSYNGGAITLAGVLQQNGNATVNSETTVTGGYFDLDGSNGSSQWTLDAPLRLIDVNNVENNTTNSTFSGTLNINNAGSLLGGGGLLEVGYVAGRSNGWEMAGVANLDGSVPVSLPFFTVIPTMIAGESVTISGTLNMQDRGAIGARAIVTGALVTADSGSRIVLNGGGTADSGAANRIAGGSVSGPGVLASTSGHALVGFGAIHSTIAFANDSDLLADDGQLIITGTIADVGTIGTGDSDGILNVTNPWNTNAADAVVFKGGSLLGANLFNGSLLDPGLITGFGTLAPNQIINDGTIAADSGTLVINTTLNPDLDGGGNGGVLNAQLGDLFIQDPVTDLFDGTANVGPGRTMTFAGGWTLSNGVLNLAGEGVPARVATVAGLAQTIRGTVHVDRNAAFDAPTTFFATADVNLSDDNDELTLQQDSAVQAGAGFTGDGRLSNAAGASLNLEAGALVGVTLENAGTLRIADSQAGSASVGALIQDSGMLAIDFAGPRALPPNDLLLVDGPAQLGGTLALALFQGLVPTTYQSSTILTSSSLGGTRFDTIAGVSYAPGLGLAVTYTATDVRVTPALLGDTDLDGDIDDADLGSSFANYTGPVGSIGGKSWINGDTDGDGDVDDADLGSSFAGYTGPLTRTTVPEPNSLALLGLGCLIAARRRRR